MEKIKKDTMLTWMGRNIFPIAGVIVSIINLWFLSKLLPIEYSIRANANDIRVNQETIIELRQTTIKLMENISDIRSDVQFIRGRIE